MFSSKWRHFFKRQPFNFKNWQHSKELCYTSQNLTSPHILVVAPPCCGIWSSFKKLKCDQCTSHAGRRDRQKSWNSDADHEFSKWNKILSQYFRRYFECHHLDVKIYRNLRVTLWNFTTVNMLIYILIKEAGPNKADKIGVLPSKISSKAII